eukprot:2976854-Rhodomonas_salina.4
MPTEIKIPGSSSSSPLAAIESTWKGIVDPLLALGLQNFGGNTNNNENATPNAPLTNNYVAPIRSSTPRGRTRLSLNLAQIPETGDVVQSVPGYGNHAIVPSRAVFCIQA